MNDYGFPPHILQGLGAGDYWGKHALYCRFEGGQYVNVVGEVGGGDPSLVRPEAPFSLWDRGDGGRIIDCEFPLKNFKGTDGNGVGKGSAAKRSVSNNYGSKASKLGQVTYESIAAVEADKYFEYIPWRGRVSPFWDRDWLAMDTNRNEDTRTKAYGGSSAELFFTYQPLGVYSICLANPHLNETSSKDSQGNKPQSSNEAKTVMDHFDALTLSSTSGCNTERIKSSMMYKESEYCNGSSAESPACKAFFATNAFVQGSAAAAQWCQDSCPTRTDEIATTCKKTEEEVFGGETWTASSKTVQCSNIASRMVQKEALAHAQASYFVSIIVVQWADLLICKTRWLSLRTQGMNNLTMNFGLFFETCLGSWMCYWPTFNMALGTRDIRFTHWLPALPWSCMIFTYDEVRKYLMRTTSPETIDKATGQVIRIQGWLERNTYY